MSAIVKRPGFFFYPGPIFSEDREVSHRIYAALVGEEIEDLSLDDAKGRATESLTTLVSTALQYRDLYRNLQGNKDCWEVITNRAILYYDLACEEVLLLLETLANARRQHICNVPPTALNNLMDAFVALQQETLALGPAHTFSVSVHPAAAAEQETRQAIAGLETNRRAISITAPWPPAYCNPQDLVALANQDVMTVLAGVDANNTAPREPYATAQSRNLPALLRIQLCHLALVRYGINKDWQLFLSPIGFFNSTQRRKWYTVAGQQAKVFSTADSFLTYASAAITHRNKTFVIGMFAHWLLQSHNLARVADLARNDPVELWTDRELMRRYATVVILRRITTGVMGSRVQVIWYDPWLHDRDIKQQYVHSQHAITDYRRQVVETLKKWATEKVSCWSRGTMAVRSRVRTRLEETG
jgi:hypothetical protein